MYEGIKIWWHCKVKGAKPIKVSSIFGSHISYTYDGHNAPYGLYCTKPIILGKEGKCYFGNPAGAHMTWNYI